MRNVFGRVSNTVAESGGKKGCWRRDHMYSMWLGGDSSSPVPGRLIVERSQNDRRSRAGVLV